MEKVVYILGAGFSAPLGLPVMSNFLEKAKDLYANERERYSHFGRVFKIIKEMSYAKNYYQCDLTNIEEILSILEMQERLNSKSRLKKSFIDFVADVVEYYTPEIGSKLQPGTHYANMNTTSTGIKHYYWFFIGSLCNLQIQLLRKNDINYYSVRKRINNSFEYSLITLNYDMLVEQFINEFEQLNSSSNAFSKMNDSSYDNNISIPYAKLHGSVNNRKIIPPTWNKKLDKDILSDWKDAYSFLKEANHIRILGYSLPESDAYIKYLLKSAIIDSEHVKSIDALCKDGDDSVKDRYTKFVESHYHRFVNRDIVDYFYEFIKYPRDLKIKN